MERTLAGAAGSESPSVLVMRALVGQLSLDQLSLWQSARPLKVDAPEELSIRRSGGTSK